ncbi:MAG: hypothetical protein ABFD89_00375 [Bryobacteraceae bacterium]
MKASLYMAFVAFAALAALAAVTLDGKTRIVVFLCLALFAFKTWLHHARNK